MSKSGVEVELTGHDGNVFNIIGLIAAAPRMYSLLVDAIDLVPRISDDDPMATALADWLRNVRAALAKADGADHA